MKISGFSFVRNGIKLYYPVIESIKSILPLCHEFVIAVGEGDPDDPTRERIAAMDDPKIKIIDTEWDERYYNKGIINAMQTDVALKECTGDWCFYLQADEVIHEKYLPVIKQRCEDLVDDEEVEGLLFDYKHFWGDYWHYHTGHGWYPHEIRIVRNHPKIHSWESAQSFRYFDYYEQPRQPEGTRKLRVAESNAEVFHYGWVRPPELMKNKMEALHTVHWGRKKAQEHYSQLPDYFDYGPLNRIDLFEESHPAVMKEKIADFNWKDKLQYSGKPNPNRKAHKHERLKYRFLRWFEDSFGIDYPPWAFNNYNLLKHK